MPITIIERLRSIFQGLKPLKLILNKERHLPTVEEWRQDLENRQRISTDRRIITKVWLDETENECDICGACEVTCPEVFTVPEKMVVKADADLTLNELVKEAADGCPTGVIAIEFDKSGKRDNPI
jgi:ferredoxin